MNRQLFIRDALDSVLETAHPFAAMAVAEAAVDSRWGMGSAARSNNLFGQPWSDAFSGRYRQIEVSTGDGPRSWPIFPNWTTAFAERAKARTAHMEAARMVETPLEFAARMSPCPDPDRCLYSDGPCDAWSRDPDRLEAVLEVYRRYRPLMESSFYDPRIEVVGSVS